MIRKRIYLIKNGKIKNERFKGFDRSNLQDFSKTYQNFINKPDDLI